MTVEAEAEGEAEAEELVVAIEGVGGARVGDISRRGKGGQTGGRRGTGVGVG